MRLRPQVSLSQVRWQHLAPSSDKGWAWLGLAYFVDFVASLSSLAYGLFGLLIAWLGLHVLLYFTTILSLGIL